MMFAQADIDSLVHDDPSVKKAAEIRAAHTGEPVKLDDACAATPAVEAYIAEYVTKDSGRRDKFETGCQRDTNEGKGRQSLIPTRPSRRLALLYERGAKKYDNHNWRKGMPFSRVIDSMIRHVEQYRDAKVLGNDGEDHLAAVAWNAFTIMEYEEAIKAGQLPPELDDRFRYPVSSITQ